MSSPDSPDLPIVDPPVASSPCRHLRTKGMYVYTDGQDQDDYDSSIYWCMQTMKNFGPDDDFVSGAECRNASRPCYEPM